MARARLLTLIVLNPTVDQIGLIMINPRVF